MVKIKDLTLKDIEGICDHGFLKLPGEFISKVNEGESSIQLREKAFYDFLEPIFSDKIKPYAVCVYPDDVSKARGFLGKNPVKIASVVGFPYSSNTKLKVYETKFAISEGANEIDMVLNYESLKAGDYKIVRDDIKEVTEICHKKDVLLKLILEACELSAHQISQACKIAEQCYVDFVKTSTTYGSYGARAEDLKVMRANFSRGIKMSGGVRDHNFKDLLNAIGNNGEIELNPLKIRIGESGLII